MNTTSSVFNTEKYEAFYKTITSDKSLATKLAAMPAEYCVEVKDSKALAEECMRAVAEFEYAKELALKDELMPALEEALNNCGTTFYERMHHLHQVNFVLNKNRAELLKEGANVEKLFADYMKEDAKAPASEEELKQNIINRISHISVPDTDISEFIKQLRGGYDMLRRSVEFGRNDYETKCLVAMNEYLCNDDGNADIHLAAYKACEETEVQAISDAINKGIMSEKKAQEYLDKITSALLFVAVVCIVTGIAEAQAGFTAVGVACIIVGVALFIEGLMLVDKTDSISASVGRCFAKHTYNKAAEKAEALRELEELLNDNADYKSLEEEHVLLEQLEA